MMSVPGRSTSKVPLRVLHICNWYPNSWAPAEVPFVARHVRSLHHLVHQRVWHIEMRQDKGRPSILRQNLLADRSWVIRSGIQRWRIIEWCSVLLITLAWWTRKRSEDFDIINIHVAYPLAVHTSWLKWLFGRPIVITEHWSAYHFEFGTSSSGLERIRSIFRQGLPLITVSHALRTDIERFSGVKQTRCMVLDNVVDQVHFHHDPQSAWQEGHFVSVLGWRHPKRPEVLIDAIALLRDRGMHVSLHMVGTGAGMTESAAHIQRMGLQDHVKLLGHLNSDVLAVELRKAHALLHCSDYETYSAACAESLVCGTPVIASAVGGIVEYLQEDLGTCVPSNDAESWAHAIAANWERLARLDRSRISSRMAQRTSEQHVGERYHSFLSEVHAREGTTHPGTAP
jgi:L-malate glycosyltransferase